MEYYLKKSIWKWVLIYVIIGAVAYGTVYYFYFYKKGGYSYDSQSLKTACDGAKDPYYDIGFGIEHTYEGEIKSGMQVKAILSCDHTKITISGSVNQIIKSQDLNQYAYGEEPDLADLSQGTQVIDFDKDYNKDGYNDFSSLVVNGTGNKQYIIFLYDSKSKLFVYDPELSFKDTLGY